MTRALTNITLWLLLLLVPACATYYQKSLKFQEYMMTGKIDKADEYLEKETKLQKGRNELLYYMNRGQTLYMLKEHEESIEYFIKADLMIEDIQKNYAVEAASFLTNPSIKPYKPEDFEKVMIHFFNSMNFLQLGNYESALVECRRINIKLNEINDKYPDHKNKYQQDAFAHLLMGLIYDASGEYNDAFIAYRNAYEVYNKDYKEYFGLEAPEQLKQDLLRTAYINGFTSELHHYEKIFKIKYKPTTSSAPQLVFFWQNGFGPIKDEWSINFTKIPGDPGWIYLVNHDLGLSFPFYIGDKPQNERNAFAQFSMLRVAFPKYTERKPLYHSASISTNNKTYKLEIAEDINQIAFKSLNDRMLRELATSLMRLATKKALEAAVNSQNQNLGTIMSITNALTEKADTRNWQTLPYSISYARIPLKEGYNKISIKTSGKTGAGVETFEFNTSKNQTKFFTFHSLESYGPAPF